jgi:glycosyltransferase involved in cell wall biosynthesis
MGGASIRRISLGSPVIVPLVFDTSNAAGFSEAREAWPRMSRPVKLIVLHHRVGGFDAEKGFHLVPEIIAACRARVPVQFVVQAYNETLDAAQLERLRRLGDEPDVRLIDEALDRDEYERLLADIDLLLFPYEHVNYRQRNSGIMAEGIAAGLPAAAPSGTWMGEQIEAGRASGVVYTGEGIDAIADAVPRAARNLPSLTRAAAALAGPWRESQSLGACLDEMERLASRSRITSSPKLT